MKEIYNRLLRLALTVGLTEREAFVDKVSEVIARKTSADPRYGERLAEGVLAAVEALRDELLLRQAFARSSQRESGREERPAEYGELIDRIDRLNRTLEELDRFFGSQPDLLGEFVRYAARQGVAPKPAEIERSKEVMLAQIKAYVGRNTPLEDNAFYHNIQSIDNVVKQALEVLSAPRPDNELHVRDTVARTEPSL